MIPISDENKRLHGFPVATAVIIGINVVVFLYELALGGLAFEGRALEQFVYAYGVTPLEITTGLDVFPKIPVPVWFTLFSSMFMHGGWMHIIGNMLYLWVFGDNIEDVLGRARYVAFYVACGLLASGAQILTDPGSRIPSIGASGAVAGVLGAYLLLYPRHRVNCLLIIFYFIRMIQLPAMVVLGFWIVLQLFQGLFSFGVATGVAYYAHIGGFAAGMALILLFTKVLRGGTPPTDDDWPPDWLRNA